MSFMTYYLHMAEPHTSDVCVFVGIVLTRIATGSYKIYHLCILYEKSEKKTNNNNGERWGGGR